MDELKASFSKVVREVSSTTTKLLKTVGKVTVNCCYCERPYETQTCWLKRKARNFCSPSCHDEARKEPVSVACEICKKLFIVRPSELKVSGYLDKKKTCSRKCLSEKRRLDLNRNGNLINKISIKGESVGTSKLTEYKVLKIRDDKRSQQEIANDYGVSQTLISQIKSRKIWSHVKDIES